jgi:ferredoxin
MKSWSSYSGKVKMMGNDAYERLREILDAHPSGAPSSKHFDEILRAYFTPEEADLLCRMSFRAKTVDEIIKGSSLKAEDVGNTLDTLAAKALIFSKKGRAGKTYALLPTIPGLFEFPFMKGITSPELKRLAGLWESYHAEAMGDAFAGNPTPLARVIPVESSVRALSNVHPYEEVKTFIAASEYFALAECACRVSVEKCDKPKDVCLIFDAGARFLVEQGFAKEITKEEAFAVLDRSEDAGLVHMSGNSKAKTYFICNCCPCCCTIMRGLTQLKNPHAFYVSSYQAALDAGECTGCGMCQDRCPMDAITVDGDNSKIDGQRCIGCGLCVTSCPVDAISLAKRKSEPDIPETVQDMGLKVATEKGKIDAFMKLMLG